MRRQGVETLENFILTRNNIFCENKDSNPKIIKKKFKQRVSRPSAVHTIIESGRTTTIEKIKNI